MAQARGAAVVNADVARRLDEVADILEAQAANPFRVRAYRNVAETLRNLPVSVAELLRTEGMEGLERIPGVGPGLGRAIRDLVETGRFGMLDRLRGESDPVALLASVPGVGPVLADRLHHELGIATLEGLETAAHAGRLTGLPGFGPKRLAGIIAALSQRLGRVRKPAAGIEEEPPSVEELLDVDREYREKAEAGTLPRITPRRLNPKRQAWLPVLHTHRGPRHYTALFSNTARAHRLGQTHDWVVLYEEGGGEERQCTVVTETHGSLTGQRVVRGREAECLAYYRAARRS